LEKLRDAPLPPDAQPSLGPLSTPIGELYRYTLAGPSTFGERQLREIQDWVIAPRLLQVPGVADVTPFGGLTKQYQVDIDPAALEKYNLSIAAVAQAIGANNRNAGGALLDNRQQSMVVRGVGLLRSAADIEQIVLTSVRGAPVLVRDIGHVHIGAALQTGLLGVNDQLGGVEGIVLMRRGENPSDVLTGVGAVVEDLNRSRSAVRRSGSCRSTTAAIWSAIRYGRYHAHSPKAW
jgi:heavy metal efflux system protein